jgi:hypothetical protein
MRTSKSFSTFGPRVSHLIAGQGGLAGEVADVRKDIDGAFQAAEGRVDFPELDWLDVTAGVLLAAGGDIQLRGRNLLQGQTFDALTLGLTTAALDLVCLKPGDSEIEVKVVQGTVESAVLSAGVLILTLATGGTTSNAMAALVNAAASCLGVVFGTGHGGGNMLVAAQIPMVGGVGYHAGNQVLVSGVEAKPKHQIVSWAAGDITVTVPALTGASPARAAGDIVTISVMVNGIKTLQLSGVLA